MIDPFPLKVPKTCSDIQSVVCYNMGAYSLLYIIYFVWSLYADDTQSCSLGQQLFLVIETVYLALKQAAWGYKQYFIENMATKNIWKILRW